MAVLCKKIISHQNPHDKFDPIDFYKHKIILLLQIFDKNEQSAITTTFKNNLQMAMAIKNDKEFRSKAIHELFLNHTLDGLHFIVTFFNVSKDFLKCTLQEKLIDSYRSPGVISNTLGLRLFLKKIN